MVNDAWNLKIILSNLRFIETVRFCKHGKPKCHHELISEHWDDKYSVVFS